MEFRFTPEQEAWRAEVRAFFEQAITEEKRADMRERRDPFSAVLWQQLADAGYLGLSWPKEHGGQARSIWEQFIFQEEAILAGCPAAVLSLMGDLRLLGRNVIHFGTPEQKAELLPLMVRGRLTSAEGLTEPGAGSDLAGLQSHAVRDGDNWILNGSKIFNLAHLTTHFLVLARTDPDLPRHRGLSFLLIDMSSPGVMLTPLNTIGRWRRNVVYFENVVVPGNRLIGEVNRGWYQYVGGRGELQAGLHVLCDTRLALRDLFEYVKTEQRDGRSLAEIPAVRQAIGDLAAEMSAAILLAWRIAARNSAGEDATAESSMAHIVFSDLQEQVLSTALDIVGPEGALESWGADLPGVPLRGRLPELYRTNRVWHIAGGTNQIKRNIIAQRALGLPRADG